MIHTLALRAALAGAALVVASGAVHAEAIKVTAKLDAPSETPPNASTGTGELTGTFDRATRKLEWVVTYSGLSGPATMAHFHAPAPVGKPAGVEIPISGPLESPIKGDATLTNEQIKKLTEGLTYFNVHTKKNPKGEIRGQVELEN